MRCEVLLEPTEGEGIGLMSGTPDQASLKRRTHLRSADVVICGAGIAGISAAYHLSVRHGIKNVLLVDERPPLSLTSDKSTECYRNFWPGPGDAMVSLMNRSIDILEGLARESGNVFHLTRRGYVYVTAARDGVSRFKRAAKESSQLGAGPLRIHKGGQTMFPYIPSDENGFESQPQGIDLILDRAILRKHFPYLSETIVAMIHARRCGWFSVQQLGMYMVDRAREHGAKLISGRVEGVEIVGNRIETIRVRQDSHLSDISTSHLVIAAGPLLEEVGRMVGVEFPVFSELHLKMSFKDHLNIVPRDAPMLIWADPIRLPWSQEDRELLAESEETKPLLDELPSGVHTRPEGGAESDVVLGLWPYHTPPVQPLFPFPIDPRYPEMVLRGLATMVPGLKRYLDRLPKSFVDGGYYVKTRENRPLIGKLPVRGAYVIAALSGFGVMSACGAGELLAAHVTGGQLPHFATAFTLERYQDPDYQKLLTALAESGQL
jgi:glycine/D-amino acid oxidase-like deaminating enzyme